MSAPTVTQNILVLTQEEEDALTGMLNTYDRAGFYLAYYAMTGNVQALEQAEITTFSGLAGGAAFAANRFLQDEYGQTGTITPDRYRGIYYLSQQVARAANAAIDKSTTGFIDANAMFQSAAQAWADADAADLFPGNLYGLLPFSGVPLGSANTPGAGAAFVATAYALGVGKSPSDFPGDQIYTIANGVKVAVDSSGRIQAVFASTAADALVAVASGSSIEVNPPSLAVLQGLLGPAANRANFTQTYPGYNGDVNPQTAMPVSGDPAYAFTTGDSSDGTDNLIITTGNATGGSGDNVILGTGTSAQVLQGGEDGDNIIWGGSGNDTLIAGNQNDILRGGAGNDTLIPGTGNDILDGGNIVFGGSQVGNDTVDYSKLPGGVTIDLTDQDAQNLNNDLIQVSKNAGGQDWLHAIKTIDLSTVASNTVSIGSTGLTALQFIDTIAGGQHPGGVQDVLDLRQIGQSIKFSNDQIAGYDTKFQNFNVLKADPGNDTIDLNTPDDSSFQEVDLGNGNDTITSNVVNLTVNLGNGNDTIGPMGPGTVINAGKGKTIFTVSDDILINDTGNNTQDEIVADGQIVHGFVGPLNSDSPWITSIYNGISYGLNSLGQLGIKDTTGAVAFVADYQGGPTVPLSQQTDGIFVGRGGFKSSKLIDLTRPSTEEDSNIFKFANEIAFIRLGHPEFPGNDDPLVLDLTGNGVNLTGESSAAPMFDMNGTGFVVHTGWTQPGTGLLVLPDANGNVTNIHQLVGGENSSGFTALAQFDTNHDGVIDANDPIYAQLRIWQDTNGNGVVDPGELETLAQAGITSINIASTAQTGDSIAGNTVNATGTFTFANGTTGTIADVSFSIDPFNSRYLGNTTVSAAAAALPNIKGHGTLTDLQVAMTNDPALSNPAPGATLIDVINETLPNLDTLDLTALRKAAMPIFDAWARAVQLPDANGHLQTIDPASNHSDVPVLLDTDSSGATVVDDFGYQVSDAQGIYYQLASGNAVKDAQGNVIARPTFADVMAQTPTKGTWTDFTADQIGFMERYLGHPLPIDSTGSDSGALIDVMSSFITASYQAMDLEAVRLAMQGPLKQYFPTIVYDPTTDHFHATTDAQLAPMYEAIFQAAPADAAGATAWLTAWKPIIDIVLGDFDRAQGVPVSYAYQFASMVHAYEASNLPLSIADAAVALGVPDGEVVSGGSTLTGTDDTQLFYVSSGDQTINDTHEAQNFVMGANFGHDVINADQSGPQQQDVLRFTTIKSTDVTASRSGIDLTLTVNATGQSVFLPGEFTGVRPGFIGTGNLNDMRGATEIDFSDGVVWDMADIAFAVAENTQATNDTLLGTGAMDVLDGRFAHYLSGGDGGDVYLFGLGDGQVTINAARTDVLALDPDVVEFGPGITPSDLTFSRQGPSLDLNITVNGTGDALTILGQFDASPNIFGPPAWFNRIDEFKFADGSTLSWSDIIQTLEAQEPTSGLTQIYGFLIPNLTNDGFVDDTLDGGPGVHYLSGGSGLHDYVFDFNHAYEVVLNNAGNSNFPADATLLFGPNVTRQDVTFSRFPGDISDLVITLSDGSTMVVDNEYDVSVVDNTINTFQFADGATLTAGQVLQQLLSQEAAAPNQIVSGSEWNETLDGAAGNEYLSGLNTFFVGRGFSNTNAYVFGHGYGQETIDGGFTSTSIVSFKPDVTPADVIWSAMGNDLVVRLKDSGDSITVLGGLGTTPINTFQFADGTTLSNSDVLNLVLDASGGGETLLVEDIGYKNAPAKVIKLGPGDTMIGDGGQSVQASGGETYDFNPGDGRNVILDQGNNTIAFGAGITASMVRVDLLGSTVVFSFPGSQDQIVFSDTTYGGGTGAPFSAIGQVIFTDGTSWNTAALLGQAQADQALQPIQNGNTTEYDYDIADGFCWAQQKDFTDTAGNITTVRVSGIDPADVELQAIGVPGSESANAAGVLLSAKDSTAAGLLLESTGGTILPFDQLVFDDGTVWTRSEVEQMLVDQQSAATGGKAIYGYGDDETLSAGVGTDLLTAGSGAETFVYARGDGDTEIQTNPVTQIEPNAGDTLVLQGIASTDVTFSRFPATPNANLASNPNKFDDLIIYINAANGQPGGKITVLDQFDPNANAGINIDVGGGYTPHQPIGKIVFSDGVVWTQADIASHVLAQEESENGDGGIIYGSNDLRTLTAGTGAEVLTGISGHDTYVWAAGDGPTIIDGQAVAPRNLGSNTLDIHGVSPANVSVSFDPTPGKDNHNLVLTAPGQAPVILEDQTDGSNFASLIHQVVFDDGTTWDYSDLVLAAGGGIATTPNGTTARAFDGTPATTTLVGTSSNDTYFWGAGDGSDTIAESAVNPWTKSDALRLVGLNPGDVTFQVVENNGPDLRITNKKTGETLTVEAQFFGASNDGSDAFSGLGYGIEKVVFANGTEWNTEQIIRNSSYVAAPGSTRVFNADLADGTLPVDASPGVTLLDGIGGDTFVWQPGDGNDTIDDPGKAGALDTLREAGVNPAAVELQQLGNNLLVTRLDTGNVTTVESEFPAAATGAGIDQIVFDDGTVWNRATINAAAAASPPPVVAFITGASPTPYDTFALPGEVIYDLGTGTFGNVNARFDVKVQLIWGATDSSQAFTIEGNQNIGALALNNLSPSDVTFYRTGSNFGDLTIKNNTTGNTFTLYNQFLASWQGVASITFAGGLTWQQSTIGANAYITAASINAGSYDSAFIFNYPVIYDLGTGTFGNVNAHGDSAVAVIWGAGDSSEQFTIDGTTSGQNSGSLVLPNLNPSDVSFYRSGPNFNDLTIANNTTGKTLTFHFQFQNSQDGVASVTFANGTTRQQATIAANSAITAASSTSGSYDTAFIFNYPVIYDLGTGTFGNVNAHGDSTVEVIWGASDSSEQFTIDGTTSGQNSGSLVLANLNPSDVSFYRSGSNFSDLTIANNTTGKTLTLHFQFLNSWDGVASITFANGTTWQQSTIGANSYITAASINAGSYDTAFIFNYPVIYDLGTGTFGNVNAHGDSVVEVIWGSGDSSQQFTIDGTTSGQNSGSLVLQGLNPSDVSFYRSGPNLKDLTIANKATGATLTLYYQLQNFWDGVASITFANGTVWQASDIPANTYITAASSSSGLYDAFFFTSSIIYDLGTGTFGNVTAHDDAAVKVIWGAGDSSQQFTIDGNSSSQNSGSLILNGLNQSDVSVYRSGSNFTDLTIANNATGATLTFHSEFQNSSDGVASVTFANGTVWQASDIAANAGARPPALSVQNASGTEDQPIALSISPTEIDPNGSLSLTISGIPADATLKNSQGALSVANGSITFSSAQLAAGALTGLAITPGSADDPSFALNVTATTTDGTLRGSTSATVNVTVSPHADAPTLTVQNAAGIEGQPIALSIGPALAESGAADPDASLALTISGIPADAALSNSQGALTFANGSITFTPAQLAAGALNGLAVTPTAADEPSFALNVTATAQDGTSSASTTQTIQVAVASLALALTISGTAQEGQTLTANAQVTGSGVTTVYQWQSSSDGQSWSNISGATASTYTVAEADEALQIRVAGTATDSEGNSAAVTSAPTIAVIDITPTLSVTVSGTAQEGQTLTASAVANDAEAVVTYQWQSLSGSTWSNISGATGSAYTAVEADEGHQLRVVATSTDADGSGTNATSAATAAVIDITPTLSVSVNGTAQEGQTLTASAVANDADAVVTYQWQFLNGSTWSNISGATGLTYTAVEADESHQLRVIATSTDSDGSSTSATSAATVAVTDIAPTLSVTVSGTAQEGQTLTATPVANDADAIITYQWQSLSGSTWSNISGATNSTYTAVEGDEGYQLRVVATSNDADGSGTTATSAATAAVIDIPPTLSVTVSGTAQEGQTLTATPVANDADAIITYQWQSLSGATWSNISGATGSTYTAVEGDEGHQLRVIATSSDADASGTTATSAATTAVIDIAPTLSVTVSGTPQEGQTLTATAVANDGDAVVTYQWQSLSGSTWSNISDATGSTYTAIEADEGHQLRVVATSTDTDGSGTTVTSAATSAVIDITPTLSVTVSGTAQEGQTITASAVANDGDAVVTYQWQSLSGSTWSNISGATNSTYTAVEADEGHQLRVIATSSDSDGSGTSATSTATAAVADITPSLSVTVSGTAQEGQPLTASAIANDADAVVTYQWQSLSDSTWSNISGATNATYTAVEADEGHQLRAIATASDADGSGTTVTSAATSAVIDITPTLSVTVSGTAQEGQTLTAAATANDADAVISYQWQSLSGSTWSNISGATNATYTAVEADEGHQFRIVATSSDADGSGTTAISAATSAVIDITPTLSVTVSGTAQEGQTLTANAAANDADAAIAYQWQSLSGSTWSNISGATASSYTASEADEGHQLRVVATSSDADGSGATATSPATSAVVDITPSLSVTISGTAQEGQTLTASAAANDADAVIAYQWQSLSGSTWSNISGATNATYTAVEADEGHQLRVVATSSDADGSGTTATSAATAAVTDIAPTLAVTVSGTAQEGQTLTATPVANDADATVTYQWQSLSSSTWSNISGATNAAYTAVEADEGHQLRVIATSSDSDGSGTSATSAATAAVIDVAPTLSATISGTAREGQTLTAAAVANDADATVTYQWQSLSGSTWSNISGATSSTYTAVEADEGHQLRVIATSSDNDGSGTTATSAATSTVIDITPTLSVTVSGIAQEGQTLTASASANDADATVTYQWQSLSGSTWSNISGATTSTHTATETDEGHQLRVIATSSDSDGSGTSATSAATSAVIDIAPTLSVTVSGTAQEGQTLTATPVANDADAVVTYQWQSLSGSTWSNISGATNATYTAGEADEGHQLRVIATSTDADGGGTSATSAATAAVTDIAPTLSVSVSGTAQEGKTLTASATANDSDAVITYQWQSLSGSTWSNIAGATSSTYTAVEGDEGHQLRVIATSSDSDGSGTSATSAATAAIVDVTPSLTVSVSGTAQEGKTLTATATPTSDADGGTTTYQWQSLTGSTWSNIAGATASTYTAAEADEGHQLRAVATFVDDTGQSVSATSSATAAVTDIAPTLSVTIGGTAQEGRTLTANGVANDADAVITYQWQSLSGTTWSNISGATSSTFLVGEANETHQLRVIATSTDSDGSGTSATSAATAAITDAPPTLSVTVSGTAQEGQTLTATATANDSDATIKYQWQSLSGSTWSNISSATSSTYKIAETNEGHQLRVVATSSDTDGSGTTANSAATAVVTDAPPKLTITSTAVTVAAGGSVALSISETTSDTDDTLTLTITGLTTYETITDAHDSTVFSGSSVTLTSAEVSSGLTLHSNYTGTGHPVNTLTVTANNTTSGEAVSSASQTITVTDPPAASSPAPATDSTPVLWRSHDGSPAAGDAGALGNQITWGGSSNSLGLGQITKGIGAMLPLIGPVGFESGFSAAGAGAALWQGIEPVGTAQGGLPASVAAALHGSSPDAMLVPGTASLLAAWTTNNPHLMIGMG